MQTLKDALFIFLLLTKDQMARCSVKGVTLSFPRLQRAVQRLSSHVFGFTAFSVLGHSHHSLLSLLSP